MGLVYTVHTLGNTVLAKNTVTHAYEGHEVTTYMLAGDGRDIACAHSSKEFVIVAEAGHQSKCLFVL